MWRVNRRLYERDIPLAVPKKTKLYVEQTQREREQAVDMHRIFQRDLCKLRLSTARAYVKIISDGHGPMSFSQGSSLRLTAQVHSLPHPNPHPHPNPNPSANPSPNRNQVQGLGPRFKLKLNLQNTGSKAHPQHAEPEPQR